MTSEIVTAFSYALDESLLRATDGTVQLDDEALRRAAADSPDGATSG